ncbi:MAG: efflux RND transporter periplasmic adaptor subunit [Candidatus Thiodiazotropha taylori]|nr:efflux RND transporter periplasmic adaptor subunit [Candidatus Thiodiazotropha taylori]MCG8108552.1 efflux RND transporter periplasmic adaptor subunit [Candidatus Thiodiazotropha taylori]MCG8112380.1 efflux RND transporter periplasmic adaptor subunit [Candidatus Thiodiazotropha taylori]MCW4280890.1 efflux RND transporter periplasmic adaptor subunit [Candidatus Thiodiazotropha taylori]MCW4284738.1 efflux RND transporter periplasmic adaptor subunit [Candidatus Thiodiazotropha taylori]
MNQSNSAVIGLALVFLSLGGCSEPPTTTQGEVIRPVKSFLIESTASGAIRTFPARIDAGRKAELAFRVSGVLKELSVKEGDQVKAGQQVAALDPTDLQIVYNDREANFDQAKRNFTRAKELVKKGNISKMDFDKLEAEFKSSSATLKAAQQDLNYTKLTAPFSGTIARLNIDNFEEVQAKQSILVLQDISELEVKFDVPENLLRGLSAEDRESAKDDVSVSVSFADIPGSSYPLSFREITTQADAKTQTFQVTYTMQRLKSANILPGMTAKVTVDFSKFDSGSDVFTVPASAIVGDYKLDPQAWVIETESMTVQPRSVKVGRLSGENIEVFEGLMPGDRIVTAGAPFLVNGMKVRLMPEKEQAMQRPEDLKYQ